MSAGKFWDGRKMSAIGKAVYVFSGEGQTVPLPLAESVVVLVVERNQGGWCRGFSAGKEGWFPASYVKEIPESTLTKNGTSLSELEAVLRSPRWSAYATPEDKIYFVDATTQGTTWEVPKIPPISPPTPAEATPPSPAQSKAPTTTNTNESREMKRANRRSSVRSKHKQKTENGLTFTEGPSDQQLLNPGEPSYVDHFWADKGEQTGFDILLEKHLNGKNAMKEMVEFFRERAALEEQYAKGLLKLSKTTFADMEEGTLGKAWQVLKAELFHRSKSHSEYAAQLMKEVEKPLLDFKESQKKERKEHQMIMEKSRKQVYALDASIEKAKAALSVKLKKQKSTEDGISLLRRSGNAITTGDDIKKLEEAYNQAQGHWADNMINACRDYERHEEERSDFLQGQWLKYIETCVAVNETSAMSLSRVTDAVDRVNKKADREFFIRKSGTGTLRPVDRI